MISFKSKILQELIMLVCLSQVYRLNPFNPNPNYLILIYFLKKSSNTGTPSYGVDAPSYATGNAGSANEIISHLPFAQTVLFIPNVLELK